MSVFVGDIISLVFFKRCTLDESDQPLKLQGVRHGGPQGEVLKFLVLASYPVGFLWLSTI